MGNFLFLAAEEPTFHRGGAAQLQNWLSRVHPRAYTSMPHPLSAQKMSVILIIQAGRPEKLFFLPAFDARILTPRSQKTGYGLLLRCRSGLNRGPDEKKLFLTMFE